MAYLYVLWFNAEVCKIDCQHGYALVNANLRNNQWKIREIFQVAEIQRYVPELAPEPEHERLELITLPIKVNINKDKLYLTK